MSISTILALPHPNSICSAVYQFVCVLWPCLPVALITVISDKIRVSLVFYMRGSRKNINVSWIWSILLCDCLVKPLNFLLLSFHCNHHNFYSSIVGFFLSWKVLSHLRANIAHSQTSYISCELQYDVQAVSPNDADAGHCPLSIWTGSASSAEDQGGLSLGVKLHILKHYL